MSALSSKVYIRLARAFRDGKGLKLSADELRALVQSDTAIETVVLELVAEMSGKQV